MSGFKFNFAWFLIDGKYIFILKILYFLSNFLIFSYTYLHIKGFLTKDKFMNHQSNFEELMSASRFSSILVHCFSANRHWSGIGGLQWVHLVYSTGGEQLILQQVIPDNWSTDNWSPTIDPQFLFLDVWQFGSLVVRIRTDLEFLGVQVARVA